MRYQTATAYACVAYRTMEKDGIPITEENIEMLIGILYDFYSEQEIEKIYRDNICFNSYQMIISDKEIKKQNKRIISPKKRNTIFINKSQKNVKNITSCNE